MKRAVRVLIVDDSAVIRGLLTRAFQQLSLLEVVGSVMHGQAALNWLKKNEADLVVMDIEMPIMDGLETLRHLRRDYPQLRVIMASSQTQPGAQATVEALSLGAAACIAKPTAGTASMAIEMISQELIALVQELFRHKPDSTASAAKKRSEWPPQPALGTQREASRKRPELLIIGASTGGPSALSRVLCSLGTDFRIPTLIVQHMPPQFTSILASHLQKETGRIVKEGAHQEIICPGVTYIAPGDYHMELRPFSQSRQLILHQAAAEHFCRPSVNPLFRSVARSVQSQVLAVMLTGMGRDGLEGTQEIVAAGGYVIAQDESTSVVWGMPGAIVQAGFAHEILPLDRIGSRIAELCSFSPDAQKVARL